MTHIITAVAEDSILMASDTRMNYHNVVDKDGRKYQSIKFVADCIRKTFYLGEAAIGIQFIGIGYFKDGADKYSLSHFVPIIQEGADAKAGIHKRMEIVFNNLLKLTADGDLGNYVNGTMAGFEGDRMYIGSFNTFKASRQFKIVEVFNGNFTDSERAIEALEAGKEKVIGQITKTISELSKAKPHSIGEEVEILEITKGKAGYLRQGSRIFDGTLTEFFQKAKNQPDSINLRAFNPPILEELNI